MASGCAGSHPRAQHPCVVLSWMLDKQPGVSRRGAAGTGLNGTCCSLAAAFAHFHPLFFFPFLFFVELANEDCLGLRSPLPAAVTGAHASCQLRARGAAQTPASCPPSSPLCPGGVRPGPADVRPGSRLVGRAAAGICTSKAALPPASPPASAGGPRGWLNCPFKEPRSGSCRGLEV